VRGKRPDNQFRDIERRGDGGRVSGPNWPRSVPVPRCCTCSSCGVFRLTGRRIS
jgi:hypothetical protein